jgi:hypothetical protein
MLGTKKTRLVVAVLLFINIVTWTPIVNQIAEGDFRLPPICFDWSDHPTLSDQHVGSGVGKTRLLYQDYAEVYGHAYQTRDQTSAPSCVGQSAACAIDILGAVETKSGHLGLPPPERSSASWFYGASRELGGINDKGGGSYCRLAVGSMVQMGFLYEDYYWSVGHDLRGDNAKRDIEFGRTLPPELKQFARHRITNYYKLNSYNDVRDAIANNMTVIVGSSVGFGSTSQILERDSQGFLRHPLLRFRGKYWFHAMALIGVSDTGRRGVLCQNSWGYWVKGPKRFKDEPEGSFWIDAAIIDKMCSQGDCFAIQGLK